jgi:hypothetical protein
MGEHTAPLRAKRHANADLGASLRDDIGEHAVGAHGGKQQCDSCEDTQELR